MRVHAIPGFPSHLAVSPLLVHALAAWASSAVVLLALDSIFQPWVASALFTVVAPGVTALVAAHYFLRHEADEALTAAICFTGTAAVLDLILEQLLRGRMELVDPVIGFGLPLILVFGATGLAGEMVPVLRRQRAR
jgi:hypothetical protein